MTRETTLALALLRENPNYVEDARQGAPVDNSVVGSLLSLQYGIPRQYAEAGVAHALALLDAEQQDKAEAPPTGQGGIALLSFTREEVEELIQGLSWSCDQGMELDEKLAHALSKRLKALLK